MGVNEFISGSGKSHMDMRMNRLLSLSGKKIIIIIIYKRLEVKSIVRDMK